VPSETQTGSLRRRFLVPLLLVVALVALFVIQRAFFPPPMSEFQDRREMMDTWVTVTVYDRDPKLAAAAMDAAFSRMARVEHEASIFDPRAEAYRLNENGRLDDPSDDLWAIMFRASRGAFGTLGLDYLHRPGVRRMTILCNDTTMEADLMNSAKDFLLIGRHVKA